MGWDVDDDGRPLGRGGDAEAERFLHALAAGLKPEERMIVCGFPGDPGAAGVSAWKPRPWAPGRDLNLGREWNGYVTVSSFGRAGDGSFRRRSETFTAGRALMVDDVGTKVDRAVVAGVPPSAVVETSPGNEQWWYFMEADGERDAARFDGVIRAFIAGKLLGADPGMAGIARVGRLPGYVNGKPQHRGWRCALRALDDRRYTTQQLLDAFGLKIMGRVVRRDRLPTEEAVERNRAFSIVYKWLERRSMLKRHGPDLSGWTEMHCPWVAGHTGAVDNGAAVREPAPENDYWGSFRCHHGSCMDRGWAELTDWVAEQATEELASVTAAGGV